MFDIKAYLGDTGVTYYDFGKNVTQGWTTISCPFCGDRSNHGGISPSGESYSCLVCGQKGHVTKLIHHLEGISWEQTKVRFSEYSSDLLVYTHKAVDRASSVEWPLPNAEKTFPSLHAQYLINRGYDLKQLRKLFDIQAVYQIGPMKYRIVIPIYENGKLVTYIGRDVTGTAPLKYRNLPEKRSVLTAKECVYNLDNVHDEALIFEGVTDVWRFSYNAVATLGLQYTQRQVRLLSERLKKAYVCFDAGTHAQQQAHALAEELGCAGVQVELLTLPENVDDPGELTQSTANELKSELFSN